MPAPLPTPQIVGGSMPSRAVGQESEGIFTFNYSGQGLLSIQTSLNGTDWHPGTAISIQGAHLRTPTGRSAARGTSRSALFV